MPAPPILPSIACTDAPFCITCTCFRKSSKDISPARSRSSMPDISSSDMPMDAESVPTSFDIVSPAIFPKSGSCNARTGERVLVAVHGRGACRKKE